jgi:hypothetical protein
MVSFSIKTYCGKCKCKHPSAVEIYKKGIYHKEMEGYREPVVVLQPLKFPAIGCDRCLGTIKS